MDDTPAGGGSDTPTGGADMEQASRAAPLADALRDRLLVEGIQLDVPRRCAPAPGSATEGALTGAEFTKLAGSPRDGDGADHACGLVRRAEVLVGARRVESVRKGLAGVERA
jgi:hypothetical protein